MNDRTRQDEAVKLRIAGHAYQEIAERLGYKSRHSAHSVVRNWARRKARAANEILTGDGRSRDPLTATQRRCYDFICGFIETEGRSPTITEIARPLSRSRSTIHQCVTHLVRKGWLEKHGSGMAGRSGLSVIPKPDEVLASQSDRMRAALESVLAWADDEGLDAPCLEDSRELLEKLSIEPS